MNAPSPSLSLVVPAYNEEKNIASCATSLVKALEKASIDYELLIVDNGSIDNTGKEIDSLAMRGARVKKVIVKKNIGYGYGIRKGLDAAGGKYIGWIDADNQADPDIVADMYRCISQGNADLVIAQRKTRNDGIMRHIASFFYNSLVSVIFLTNIKDANAKPKMFKKQAYADACITSNDWFIDTELLLKFKAKKHSVVAIECVYKERKHGKSNVRLGTVFEFLKNVVRFKAGMI